MFNLTLREAVNGWVIERYDNWGTETVVYETANEAIDALAASIRERASKKDVKV